MGEPIVRDSIERLLPDERFGDARYVGSFWGRNNHPQIDLVGTSRRDGGEAVAFAGSVKWRSDKLFDERDLTDLAAQVKDLPGWDEGSRGVDVSRTGFAGGIELDVKLTPEELLAAWR